MITTSYFAKILRTKLSKYRIIWSSFDILVAFFSFWKIFHEYSIFFPRTWLNDSRKKRTSLYLLFLLFFEKYFFRAHVLWRGIPEKRKRKENAYLVAGKLFEIIGFLWPRSYRFRIRPLEKLLASSGTCWKRQGNFLISCGACWKGQAACLLRSFCMHAYIFLSFFFVFFDNNGRAWRPTLVASRRPSRPPEMSSIENFPPENGTFGCEEEKEKREQRQQQKWKTTN